MQPQYRTRLTRFSVRTSSGFTLIEMAIAIAIMAIAASIAIPSFVGYIQRGKLTSGTEALISLRGLMEQAYQADRSFQNAAGTCAIADFTDDYFVHTCTTASSTTYTWTSSSRASVGLGSSAGHYVYTLNQDGDAVTLYFAGSPLTGYQGWKIRN